METTEKRIDLPSFYKHFKKIFRDHEPLDKSEMLYILRGDKDTLFDIVHDVYSKSATDGKITVREENIVEFCNRLNEVLKAVEWNLSSEIEEEERQAKLKK